MPMSVAATTSALSKGAALNVLRKAVGGREVILEVRVAYFSTLGVLAFIGRQQRNHVQRCGSGSSMNM
jgi:hypothetical protein